MAYQIQIRNDLAANWTSINPTLAQAEFGYESNTGKIKLGDGVTAWNSLSYSFLASLTSFGFTNANGFTGSVANPTTTPTLTLSTSVTGILYGNGTSVAAAIAANFPTLNQNTSGTASNVTGTVAIANGGTGQVTANAALNALLPSQTGNTGFFLQTNGTNTSWVASSSSVAWGAITGTLSAQTDLQTALNAKQPLFSRTAVSSNYTTVATDNLVAVTSTASVVTITLISAATFGVQPITIKDESGAASVNNIIVNTSSSQTIDGLSTVRITINYGVLRLYSNGSNWFSL